MTFWENTFSNFIGSGVGTIVGGLFLALIFKIPTTVEYLRHRHDGESLEQFMARPHPWIGFKARVKTWWRR